MAKVLLSAAAGQAHDLCRHLEAAGFAVVGHALGAAPAVDAQLRAAVVDKAFVHPGLDVKQGAVIGTIGNSSGVARDRSFCTHVHFEVKTRGVLGDVSDGCRYWGYTPGRPEGFGYIDAGVLIDGRDLRRALYPYVDRGGCPGAAQR